jgi:RND family efflux transporter MFP subunit
MTKSLITFVLFLSVVAIGCQNEYPAKANAQKTQALPSTPPREVRVVPATDERLARTITVTGTLAAEEQVILSMKVSGRLGEIGVDMGSHIRKGQAIASLDPTDFRLRVEQAEAALKQARARLGLSLDSADDRVNPEETALVRQARAVLHEARLTRDRRVVLWERRLISRAELDKAEAELLVAEGRYQDAIEEVRNRQAILAQRRSELAIARQQLTDATLYAPMDSVVRERHAAVGQYLAAGTPVVTIVRIHPLRLRLAVPEREAASVQVGQTVRVTVEGDSTVYTGHLARLSPAISENNRTLLVEAEVPNEKGVLRPGAFTKTEIITEASQPVVLVPATSIVTFAGIEKVLSVHNGQSVEKRVRTGRRAGDRVEILQGLTAGELVIIEPGNLVGGQPVTVIP